MKFNKSTEEARTRVQDYMGIGEREGSQRIFGMYLQGQGNMAAALK